ncbi:MAG: hypothetical protein GY754_13465 [bacterium]|nr:hypothetical protein [bacterium]
MRKNLRSFFAGLLVVSVFGFMGCEAGLTSNDSSGKDDEFSFSKIYSDIKELKGEIKRLQQVNEEQEATIEALSGSSSSSIGAISERIDTLEGDVGGISVAISERIDTLEGYVGGISVVDLNETVDDLSYSVVDLKDTVDNLSYSVADSWSGTTLTTPSLGYQYVSGAPEIILTGVKEGDVFLASFEATAKCGYSTLVAASGSIKWLGSSPVLNFGNSRSKFSHQNAIGIFKATSNGKIIIRMHIKGHPGSPCGEYCYIVSGPIYANQGTVLVSKLGIQ